MNRCLTEGRQALAVRLAGIQGGIECAKLSPQLSALADGEASSEDIAALRPHLKTCLACRARLKAFREAPKRVAALVPPVVLAADDGDSVRGLVESAVGAIQHKAAAFGERAQTAAELVTAQKVAAVAASAAALAGGGTAVDPFANHEGPPQPTPPADQVEAKPVKEAEVPVNPAPPEPTVDEQPAAEPTPAPVPQPESPPPPPPPPPPGPDNEFAPAGSAPAAAAPAASHQPASAPPQPAVGNGRSTEFAP